MTEVMEKTDEKTYNIYFMKEIFDYVNTRNFSKQDVVIFDNELLESYIKKQFLEVYLPGTHQLIWSNSKSPRKEKVEVVMVNGKKTKKTEKTEFIEVNDKFLEQFAKENGLQIEQKINYDSVMKQKFKNDIKKYVSDYLVKELVERMVLQYDKQEIIDVIQNGYVEKDENGVEKITQITNIKELPLPEKKTAEECVKKEQYKCEVQYGKFLSHVRDPLNDLKSSYVNMLKIILKSINNQVMKNLQEYHDKMIENKDKDKQFFKMTTIKNNKKTDVKQIEVKGSGKTFQDKCYEIIHNVLKEYQEKVIDTKDKKTQFCINKKSFEKLADIYKNIHEYKEDITPVSYDITTLTTFVNRQIKSYTNGVSIPVTQYYIKEYLPTIICHIINRLNAIGKKVEEKTIFELDNVDNDILNDITVNITKVISHIPIKEKVDKKEKKEDQPE